MIILELVAIFASPYACSLAVQLSYCSLAVELSYCSLAVQLAYCSLAVQLAYCSLAVQLAYCSLTVQLAYCSLAVQLAYCSLAVQLAYWGINSNNLVNMLNIEIYLRSVGEVDRCGRFRLRFPGRSNRTQSSTARHRCDVGAAFSGR